MHDASNIGLLKFSFSDQRLVNSRENIDCKRKKNSIKFSEIRESQFFSLLKNESKRRRRKKSPLAIIFQEMLLRATNDKR